MNSQLELWLDHPVTKKYRKILDEHKQAAIYAVFNQGVLTPERVAEIAQLKGQVNAFDIMLNTEELEFQLREELEKDDEEIHRD